MRLSDAANSTSAIARDWLWCSSTASNGSTRRRPPPSPNHRTGTPTPRWAGRCTPDGLRKVLHRAARSGLPLYVTENDIATEDDNERIECLHAHLAVLAQARPERVDVRGYLHCFAFDNFEWSEGYRPKFGPIAVDHADDFARIPRPSARAFAKIADNGELPKGSTHDTDSNRQGGRLPGHSAS